MNKKIIIILSIIAMLLIGALAFLGVRLAQANKNNDHFTPLIWGKKKFRENP